MQDVMTKKTERVEPIEQEEADEQEMFMQMEIIDDKSIISDMQGHANEDYVYSFKQGGRAVQGLTLKGILEAANKMGGIQVDELQIKDNEDSWIVTAKAFNINTSSSRWGACQQPKKAGSREDPYAFSKAVSKAQRNALKQLLPAEVQKEVLDFYLKKNKRR